MLRIVASRNISHAFVSGGQDDDGEEGKDEGERAGDAPLREDDAEVLGREREEHLLAWRGSQYWRVWTGRHELG